MRRIFVVLIIIVLVLVAMVLFVPYLVEDKVEEYVDSYIAENLDASIQYKSELTFFRHFPDVSLELTDVMVSVSDRFENDTIAFAGRVDLLIPLFDAIKGEKVKIKEAVIKKGSLVVVDPENASEFYLYNISGSIKEDNVDGRSEINLKLDANDFTFVKDSVVYLGGARLVADAQLLFDPAGKRIEVGQNTIRLNEIDFVADGYATFSGKTVNVDIGLSTGECQVKSVLESLSPFGFEINIDGSGECVIDAYLTGLYDNDRGSYPGFEMEIECKESNITVFDGEQKTHSAFIDGTMAVAPLNGETTFKYNLDSLNFDSLGATGVEGNVTVTDSLFVIERVTLMMFDGQVTASGSLSRTDSHGGALSAEVNCEDIDINAIIDEVPSFGNFVPSVQSVEGMIDLYSEFTALLGKNMAIDPYSIEGEGVLSSGSIVIKESTAFENMKKVLQLGDEYQSGFDDLDIHFSVSNGRMYVEPFDTSVGDLKMNVSGEHGLDQSLNYVVKTEMPRSALSGSVNSLIDIFSSGLSAFGVKVPVDDIIRMDIKITGFFVKPVITPIL